MIQQGIEKNFSYLPLLEVTETISEILNEQARSLEIRVKSIPWRDTSR
jgi:hypothetical protein